ncbi:hypothetical protein B9T27_02500 [Acinetobacter sp. ANC 4648]|nr:ESPR-type extended signal peptide-containing protein [Acinetobacter sp. ANC 4648]OTG85103.1 hypothetical protein B9T27_02500 [Acinetobacter sp. ANC 4648]
MNNIYKVIWNATLGTWIAVSELAKAKTKSSKVTAIIGTATIFLMVSLSPAAMATGMHDDDPHSSGQNWKINTGKTGTGTVSGNSSTAVGSGDEVKFIAGNNIALTQAGKTITVATNPDLVSTSITTGNSQLNNNGLTIVGGPSVTTGGINAGNKTITNVASGGMTTTNAANIGDLNTATLNTTNALTSKGLDFAGNSGANVHRNLGQVLDIKGGFTGADAAASNENVKTVTTANGIDVRLAKNVKFDSVATGASSLDSNGLSISGGSKFTSAGISAGNQVINNVADGVALSDAVNKGQLDTTNQNITNLQNQTFKIQANGDAATAVKSSDTVQFKDGANIQISRSGNDITFATAPTVNFDQVTVGSVITDKAKNTIVGLSNTSITASDFATVGRAASEEQLKKVADNATNANRGWTFSTTKIGTGIRTLTNNSSTTVAPGDDLEFVAGNNIELTQVDKVLTIATNPDLISTSITTGNSKLDNNGVSIGSVVQLGGTGLTIVGGPSVTTGGISAGNKIITNVANGIVGSDAVNKSQLDSAIINVQTNINQVNDQAVLYNKNPDSSVDKNNITLAGGDNGTGIHNLADGAIAAGSKDAVNGGQLADVRDSLQGQIDITTTYLTNFQTTLDSGSMGLVKQVDGPKGVITVAKDTGGTTVNISGTDGNRVITGVAKGAVNATSTDVINGSQLNTTNQAVVSYLGGGAGYDNITGSFNAPAYKVDSKEYNNVGGAIDALNQADQNLNSKINNVNNKLDDAFRATNHRIDSVEDKANAGIAAAMALESAPYIAGKYTYAVGAAYHSGENAVGVTLRKTADNGRWSVTGGVAVASQGDPSVRIGISGVID